MILVEQGSRLLRHILINVLKYSEEMQPEWDRIVSESSSCSLLFYRNYMDYHSAKFQDKSLMFFAADKLVAVFPAAISLANTREVVSHPGLTFGGLIISVHDSQDFTEPCLLALLNYYSKEGFESLVYKSVPSIYHGRPAEQGDYFLWKSGFECFRIDLSVSVNLNTHIRLSSRRSRGLKKAQQTLDLSNDLIHLVSFWNILTKNLEERYSRTPTHSIDEIKLLISRFPDQIVPTFALKGGNCVAGVLVYKSHRVHHAQYISASTDGKDLGALDLIFSQVFQMAQSEGVSYFDFGVSTINEGRGLNKGLYTFKYEFGGGGICHRFYKKDL